MDFQQSYLASSSGQPGPDSYTVGFACLQCCAHLHEVARTPAQASSSLRTFFA